MGFSPQPRLLRVSALKALLLVTLVLPLFSQPNYEIYAVRYATIPDFGVNELVAGADRSRNPPYHPCGNHRLLPHLRGHRAL